MQPGNLWSNALQLMMVPFLSVHLFHTPAFGRVSRSSVAFLKPRGVIKHILVAGYLVSITRFWTTLTKLARKYLLVVSWIELKQNKSQSSKLLDFSAFSRILYLILPGWRQAIIVRTATLLLFTNRGTIMAVTCQFLQNHRQTQQNSCCDSA